MKPIFPFKVRLSWSNGTSRVVTVHGSTLAEALNNARWFYASADSVESL